MPRNVRNFWLEADIDGRAGPLVGGPVAKDGGFTLTVYIRDEGSVERAVTLRGYHYDGKNILDIEPHNKESVESLTGGGFRVKTNC